MKEKFIFYQFWDKKICEIEADAKLTLADLNDMLQQITYQIPRELREYPHTKNK